MDSIDLFGEFLQQGNDAADDPFADGVEWMAECGLSEQDMLNDLETEEFLSSLFGPLEDEKVPCQSWSPQGSDSGISEDNNNFSSPSGCDSSPSPSPKLPETHTEAVSEVIQTDHNYSLQHLQDSSDTLQSVRSEIPETDVFIDLDDWDSECVGEDCSTENPVSLAIEDASDCNGANHLEFKELVLTDEEKRILAKEGVTIPTLLPLTKAEERTLKRVRRKIRNKQSAQESRKKKKVYVDGLESRVAACTAQNQELQKKVQQLQKQNMSLIEQLRKLQALMKQTTMKTTTTSTFIMVFLLSFCLIIFPSVNPFGSSGNQKDLYISSNVLSRNIRSLPSMEMNKLEYGEGAKDINGEDVFLPSIEHIKTTLKPGGQNHTPDYQKVDQAESESAVSSNSSSDFPSQGKTNLTPAAGQDNRQASAREVRDYQTTGPAVNKDDWMDRKSTSVIIQQHRSDEM
ncbi:CR3L3 protein, partial [Atractosteus spatula]|nr:CR3L3 protein [Atractosteus spatula]